MDFPPPPQDLGLEKSHNFFKLVTFRFGIGLLKVSPALTLFCRPISQKLFFLDFFDNLGHPRFFSIGYSRSRQSSFLGSFPDPGKVAGLPPSAFSSFWIPASILFCNSPLYFSSITFMYSAILERAFGSVRLYEAFFLNDLFCMDHGRRLPTLIF